MAKGEAKSSAVNLRFTAEYRKRLEAAAKAKGHTLSHFIRETLDAAL